MARNETKIMESIIALSEELNFTRAARKCHVSQSAITKNLKELERMLGFRLFERDRKSVRPTDASRAYVEQARISLQYGERALQAARAAMQNADVILNVGRSPYTDPYLISTLLSLRLPLYPQLKVELSSGFSCDLVHNLLAGGLDLAIATEPPESALLTKVEISNSPFYIAMSQNDELAKSPSITLGALAGRCWVLFERHLHQPLYDTIMQLIDERNVRPARIQHITIPEESFPSVADGSCVAFVVKTGAIRMARNGVTIRPLEEDALQLRTYLVSMADNESRVASELVRAFVRKLTNVAKAQTFHLKPTS